MVTFLITILALGIIAIAIYFWQKPAKTAETIELPPPPPGAGLFANHQPEQLATAAPEPDQADGDAKAHNDELEARKALAEEFIVAWQVSPDRVSTAKMLHLAALADDAETFRTAVETALKEWQRGSVPDLSAAELQTLCNSEFWILSPAARSSGAGFVLKRTLSRAKRDLERANNPT
jgi:hypothetical protein